VSHHVPAMLKAMHAQLSQVSKDLLQQKAGVATLASNYAHLLPTMDMFRKTHDAVMALQQCVLDMDRDLQNQRHLAAGMRLQHHATWRPRSCRSLGSRVQNRPVQLQAAQSQAAQVAPPQSGHRFRPRSLRARVRQTLWRGGLKFG
jgi:hypothetical protein